MKQPPHPITIYRTGKNLFKGIIISLDFLSIKRSIGKRHPPNPKSVNNLNEWRKKQKALSSKKKVVKNKHHVKTS